MPRKFKPKIMSKSRMFNVYNIVNKVEVQRRGRRK